MASSDNNAAASASEQTPLLDGKQTAKAASPPTTYPGWGLPAGLGPRKPDDPLVVLYRQAVGVNYNADCGGSQPGPSNNNNATGGRCEAEPGSIYQQTVSTARGKAIRYNALNNLVNGAHIAQIVVGAALTALGPASSGHGTAIMRLGAANTVMAGMLALFKAQGLPARLNRAAVEYRRLQEWIEETDALLLAGVVGRDREEVGRLVETTFRKFNSVLENEEGNTPSRGSIRQHDADEDRGRSAPPPSAGQPQQLGQANGQNGQASSVQ